MANKKQTHNQHQCANGTQKQTQILSETTPEKFMGFKLRNFQFLAGENSHEIMDNQNQINRIPQGHKDKVQDTQNAVREVKPKYKAGQLKNNVKLIYQLKKKISSSAINSQQQIVTQLEKILVNFGPLAKFHDNLEKFTSFAILSEEKLTNMQDRIKSLQNDNRMLKKEVSKLSKCLKHQSQELDSLKNQKKAANLRNGQLNLKSENLNQSQSGGQDYQTKQIIKQIVRNILMDLTRSQSYLPNKETTKNRESQSILKENQEQETKAGRVQLN